MLIMFWIFITGYTLKNKIHYKAGILLGIPFTVVNLFINYFDSLDDNTALDYFKDY